MRLSTSFDFARRRQIAARSRTQTLAATRALRVLGWMVLAAAALALYLPALGGDLVWEDAALTGATAGAGETGPAYRDVLRHDRELGSGPERYRPLTQLSFRADLARGGRALDFHTTSLALHLLNIALLYAAARRMRLSLGAAWLAALLFAVYPLCTTAVGHIGGREEVLAMTFILLTFLLHASGRWLYEPAAVLCFALALLARPAAAGVGLVLLAWEFRRGGSIRRSLARLAPYAAVGLVVLAVVRHQFGTLGFMSAREAPPGSVALTLPAAFYRLVQLMLRPFPATEPSVLNFRAQNLVEWARGWSEPGMLVGLVFVLGYAAATWLTRRGRGRAFLALVALPALWLPLDSLFFGRAFDLTRNLYAPSAAFALLLALIVERAGFEPRAGNLRRGVVAGAAGVVVLSFLVSSQVRVAVWHDETNVYLEAMNRFPSVAEYHAAYGTTLARRGDELPAVDELRRAVEVQPDLGVAHYNLGLLQMSLARYAESSMEFRRATVLLPQDAEVWYRWSLAERKLGNVNEALAAATRAVSLDDTRAEYHLALASARLDHEDAAEAEAEARRAVSLDGRNAGAYATLAAVMRKASRLEEAISAAAHAVQLDPRSAEAALEYGRALAAAGRTAEALDQLSAYGALEPHPEKSAIQLRDRLKKRLGS